MRRNTQKQKYLALGALVLLISLGYAFLSANLKIDGVTNIGSSEWNVHFDNVYAMYRAYNATSTATEAYDGNTPYITGSNNDEISFDMTLDNPGDTYTLMADVVNDGSMDAEIDGINTKIVIDNGEEEDLSNLPSYLEYSVTYEDDTEIEAGHRLNKGEKETIKVTVKFKGDISNEVYQELMNNTKPTIEFRLSLDYVQADVGTTATGSGISSGTTPSTSEVYTLSMYNNGESQTRVGETIPNDVTVYASPTLAMNGWSIYGFSTSEYYGNDIVRPIFLKHTLNENNVITESFVGVMVTQEMAENNPGMTAGIYYLNIGMQNELSTAFGSTHCNMTAGYYICNVSGLSGNINYISYNLIVFADNRSCFVNNDGYSYCN